MSIGNSKVFEKYLVITMLERIRALCKRNNMSVTELEKQLGFGNGTIGHWRTSKPKYDKLVLISDYFGVSVDYLLTGGETPAPPEGGGLVPEDFAAKYWSLSERGRAELDRYARYLQSVEEEQKEAAGAQEKA